MERLKISKGVVEKSLRQIAPMLAAALATVEKNGGRTHFSKGLLERAKLAGINNWAELYLEPKKVTILSLLGVYTTKQLEDIARNLTVASEAERLKFWEELIEYLSTDNWMDAIVDEYLEGMTLDDIQKEFESIMEVADNEFKIDVAHKIKATLLSLLVTFHNTMAMNAYGAPMSLWVSRAMAGDMQSYFKAFHVDQTVADLPHFAALHEQKKQELNGRFFSALSLRRRTALIPERLKYPKLMFTFAYLDSFDVLPSKNGDGFTLEHLLDLCAELKIYGENCDKGVDDLSHRLQDYRKLQKKLMARKFMK